MVMKVKKMKGRVNNMENLWEMIAANCGLNYWNTIKTIGIINANDLCKTLQVNVFMYGDKCG